MKKPVSRYTAKLVVHAFSDEHAYDTACEEASRGLGYHGSVKGCTVRRTGRETYRALVVVEVR